MLMQQLAALRSQGIFKFPFSCSTVCSPARLLIPQTACSAMIAFIRGQFSTPISKVSRGYFTHGYHWHLFRQRHGNTENIAKMIQKQLGKDVAESMTLQKAAKKIWKLMTFCCWHPNLVLRRSAV